MATTILAFAVIAVTQAVAVAQMQTYEALHNGRATSLAEAFLEEVVSKPYFDPAGGDVTSGPEEDETARNLFDNIDDYDGFVLDTLKDSDPDVIGDITGNAYPANYQKFIVTISASYTTVSFFEDVIGINVTVTVTDHTGRVWQTTRFVPETGG